MKHVDKEMEGLLGEIPHATSPDDPGPNPNPEIRHYTPFSDDRLVYPFSSSALRSFAAFDDYPFRNEVRPLPLIDGREAARQTPLDPSVVNPSYKYFVSNDANRYDIGQRGGVSSVFSNSSVLDTDRETTYLQGLFQQQCCVSDNLSQRRLQQGFASSYPNRFGAVPSGRMSYQDVGLNQAVNQAQIDLAFLQAEQNRVDNDALSMYHHHRLLYGSQVPNGRVGLAPNCWAPRTSASTRSVQDYQSYVCGDSLIIPGRGLCYAGYKNKGDAVKGTRARRHGSPISTLNFDSLDYSKWSIYILAKDQHGCRHLQKKFDDGKHWVDEIFSGVIEHVAELMINPFGNYLMQKMFDVCSEEQRTAIILMLTQRPLELFHISLNIHGTRAVQKLIDTLKTQTQINMVISALQSGFLILINDLNGNHVLQRCITTLSYEDNKFILDAAVMHCVNISTQRHGCVVLQICISYSTGIHRAKFVAELSCNALFLAQDPYGNFVVQFLLDLKNPSANEEIASQFRGNYVHLSTQKFSSNVVEKCLKIFGEKDRNKIIIELLSVPRFENLLQDQYGNFVIQRALAHSKDKIHAALVEAIRPHAEALRTSPYCKKILSRPPFKKC